jgi:hypothetical protein
VYEQTSKQKTPETALTAGNFRKIFRGECRICGAKGHKARDCWDNDKNKSKRPIWYKNPDQRNQRKDTAILTVPSNDTANTVSEKGNKPKYFCKYCKKAGHTEDRCFKKRRDNGTNNPYPGTIYTDKIIPTANVALFCYETCLLTTNGQENVNINTFIADSGASAHMVHSKSLLKNNQEESGEVKIGDRNEIKSLGKGTIHGYYTNKDGEVITITLNYVLLVPDIWVNLFSITEATSNKDCKVVCED